METSNNGSSDPPSVANDCTIEQVIPGKQKKMKQGTHDFAIFFLNKTKIQFSRIYTFVLCQLFTALLPFQNSNSPNSPLSAKKRKLNSPSSTDRSVKIKKIAPSETDECHKTPEHSTAVQDNDVVMLDDESTEKNSADSTVGGENTQGIQTTPKRKSSDNCGSLTRFFKKLDKVPESNSKSSERSVDDKEKENECVSASDAKESSAEKKQEPAVHVNLSDSEHNASSSDDTNDDPRNNSMGCEQAKEAKEMHKVDVDLSAEKKLTPSQLKKKMEKDKRREERLKEQMVIIIVNKNVTTCAVYHK